MPKIVALLVDRKAGTPKRERNLAFISGREHYRQVMFTEREVLNPNGWYVNVKSLWPL